MCIYHNILMWGISCIRPTWRIFFWWLLHRRILEFIEKQSTWQYYNNNKVLMRLCLYWCTVIANNVILYKETLTRLHHSRIWCLVSNAAARLSLLLERFLLSVGSPSWIIIIMLNFTSRSRSIIAIFWYLGISWQTAHHCVLNICKIWRNSVRRFMRSCADKLFKSI